MSEKKRRDCLVRWVKGRRDALLVWEDECWFSRFAQPTVKTWAQRDQPFRLAERTLPAQAPDKALACYGALCDDTRQVYLHFTWGQPDSEATIDYLQRLLALARGRRKQYLVIVWDNASWHLSRKVRAWLKSYKQQAKTLATFACWSAISRQRVPGSTRLSRTGLTPSARPWIQRRCRFHPTNSATACFNTLAPSPC